MSAVTRDQSRQKQAKRPGKRRSPAEFHFSSDIAYSDSPAASRASAQSS